MIDQYQFIEDIPEDYVCVCCQEILQIPCITPCKHSFCKKCILKWHSQSGNCPICRSNIAKNQLKIDMRIVSAINNLQVICRFPGCYWVGALKKMPLHRAQCEFSDDVPELLPESNIALGPASRGSLQYQSLFSKLYDKFGIMLKPSFQQAANDGNLKRKLVADLQIRKKIKHS